MNVRASHLFASVFMLTIAGLLPSEVEAGYVHLTDPGAVPLMTAGNADGMGSHSDARIIESEQPDPCFHAPSATATAPSPPSAATGGASTAVLNDAAALSSAQLIQRLGVRNKAWLHPPFLSGVFRPPRFVG